MDTEAATEEVESDLKGTGEVGNDEIDVKSDIDTCSDSEAIVNDLDACFPVRGTFTLMLCNEDLE